MLGRDFYCSYRNKIRRQTSLDKAKPNCVSTKELQGSVGRITLFETFSKTDGHPQQRCLTEKLNLLKVVAGNIIHI